MRNIINLGEYKAFASIEGSKSDPQIEALILYCSKIVQEFLGYDLTSSGEFNVTIPTSKGRQSYFLPNIDTEVTTLAYTKRGSSDTTVLSSNDYCVYNTGRLDLYNLTPGDGDRLVATCWLPEKTIEDIQLATMLLVKYYYKEEFNKSSVGMGGQTVSYQTGKNFPPHVRAILMMHRML